MSATRDPRRAYRVVDAFEEEIADYCGSPFAVTVDSCSNALYASLMYEPWAKASFELRPRLSLPRRTYVGVLQAAQNAGYAVEWDDAIEDWQTFPGFYWIAPTRVCDAARTFVRGLAADAPRTLICVSFHAAKQLPLGRGGAILTDDEFAVEWLQRFRADGRAPGDTGTYATFPAAHCYMPPDVAARGLWILSRWNDSGYSPPPLPPDAYKDLSAIANDAPSKPSGASPHRMTVNP